LLADRTEWAHANLLYAAVPFRGRAAPIAMLALPGPKSTHHQELAALPEQAARAIPEGRTVTVVGDREFGSVPMTEVIRQRGWHSCLCLKQGTWFCAADGTQWQARDRRPAPGRADPADRRTGDGEEVGSPTGRDPLASRRGRASGPGLRRPGQHARATLPPADAHWGRLLRPQTAWLQPRGLACTRPPPSGAAERGSWASPTSGWCWPPGSSGDTILISAEFRGHHTHLVR
jgi:hypothetical protein